MMQKRTRQLMVLIALAVKENGGIAGRDAIRLYVENRCISREKFDVACRAGQKMLEEEKCSASS